MAWWGETITTLTDAEWTFYNATPATFTIHSNGYASIVIPVDKITKAAHYQVIVEYLQTGTYNKLSPNIFVKFEMGYADGAKDVVCMPLQRYIQMEVDHWYDDMVIELQSKTLTSILLQVFNNSLSDVSFLVIGLYPEASASGGASTASELPIANTDGHFTSTNVEGALNEVFTLANDGKHAIVDALVSKFAIATYSDTFATLADTIRKLLVTPCVPLSQPISWLDVKAGKTLTQTVTVGVQPSTASNIAQNVTYTNVQSGKTHTANITITFA